MKKIKCKYCESKETKYLGLGLFHCNQCSTNFIPKKDKEANKDRWRLKLVIL